jgi:hypothetical protein
MVYSEPIVDIAGINALENEIFSKQLIPANLTFTLEFTPAQFNRLIKEYIGLQPMVLRGITELKYKSVKGIEWTLKQKSYRYK